jgi:hypothetical protein
MLINLFLESLALVKHVGFINYNFTRLVKSMVDDMVC